MVHRAVHNATIAVNHQLYGPTGLLPAASLNHACARMVMSAASIEAAIMVILCLRIF